MWFRSRILSSISNITKNFDKKKSWITSKGTVIIHIVSQMSRYWQHSNKQDHLLYDNQVKYL